MNFHLAAHRIESFDPDGAAKARSILSRPEATRSREDHDALSAVSTRARSSNLGYLAGRAFERGMFRMLVCRSCTEDQFSFGQFKCIRCGRLFDQIDADVQRDGRELLQAADIYAGLHRQVWGKLSKDIEEVLAARFPHGSLDLLKETGPIRRPAPAASQFRKWVAEDPAPVDDSDPEKYEARRMKLIGRYAESREVLLKRGLHCLAVVENVVIDGIEPAFLRSGQACTDQSAADQLALSAGLWALADHYGLFDKRIKDHGASARV
jgi:hypothetical protein